MMLPLQTNIGGEKDVSRFENNDIVTTGLLTCNMHQNMTTLGMYTERHTYADSRISKIVKWIHRH